MKALSLTQPWATLVACGTKQIETRSWRTSYRGPVAIHATRQVDWDACAHPDIRAALVAGTRVLAGSTADERATEEWIDLAIRSMLPVSAVLAVVTIADVMPVEAVGSIMDRERAFGNFAEGRFAWMLANCRAMPLPIPCRGMQGLWTLPDGIKVQIEDELV